jgi:hypothetical protein
VILVFGICYLDLNKIYFGADYAILYTRILGFRKKKRQRKKAEVWKIKKGTVK